MDQVWTRRDLMAAVAAAGALSAAPTLAAEPAVPVAGQIDATRFKGAELWLSE